MPITKTADIISDANGKWIVRDLFIYVLPMPDSRDRDGCSSVSFSGFVNALFQRTNSHYKEKVRKDFEEWLNFKKKNKDNMCSTKHLIYADKQQEKKISEWLKSKDIQLSSELKEILKSYEGKVYPTKEELLKNKK